MHRGTSALPLVACLLAAPPALAETLFRGTLAERVVVRDDLPAAEPGEAPVQVGYRFGAAGGSTTRARLEPVTDGAFVPSLRIRDASGSVVLEDASAAGAELVLFLDDDVEGLYTLTLGDAEGAGSGAYRLEFEHEDHGNPAPSPERGISLAPNTWHLLMPPVETDASYRDLFVTDGGLDADGYGGAGGGAFAVYAWDPAAVDADGTVAGGYRRPALDEPLGSATGFWFIHVAADAVTVSVPDESAGPPRSRVYGDGGEDGVGPVETTRADSPSCPDDAVCTLRPLAPSGGWTMTGVPSLRPAAVREMRLVTDEAAGCAGGCALDDAATLGLATDVVYTYDLDTADGRRYAARAGEARVPPWQAFWVFSAGAAGAELAVPTASLPGPRSGDGAAPGAAGGGPVR